MRAKKQNILRFAQSPKLKNAHQKRTSTGIGRGPKNMLIYLAFWDSRVYNVVKANKGRAKGATNTLRPYAGEAASHTIAFATPASLYRTFHDFTRPGLGFVSVLCGVGYYILRRFCLSRWSPRKKPEGDGCNPTPTGRTIERRKTLYIRRRFI